MMLRLGRMWRRTFRRPAAMLAVGSLSVLLGNGELQPATQPEPWVAPARAAKKQNPEHADANSIEVGKRIFLRECISCHGPKGMGDGPKAADLERKPGNLSAPAIWEQSDGALFWKISEGRAPMPATKAILSEDERWHVLNYVRTLAPQPAAPTPPQFAVPDAYRQATSIVAKAYEPIRVALSGNGDGAAAAKGVPALSEAVAALAKLDVSPLPDAAKNSWREDGAACTAAVADLKNAGDDLTKLRAAFTPVSASLIRVIERYGHAEADPILVFVADSAKGGAATPWLQIDPKPHSPYGAATDPQAPQKRVGGQRKS
jgi:mono/diheme cytochrome c family protein